MRDVYLPPEPDLEIKISNPVLRRLFGGGPYEQAIIGWELTRGFQATVRRYPTMSFREKEELFQLWETVGRLDPRGLTTPQFRAIEAMRPFFTEGVVVTTGNRPLNLRRRFTTRHAAWLIYGRYL